MSSVLQAHRVVQGDGVGLDAYQRKGKGDPTTGHEGPEE